MSSEVNDTSINSDESDLPQINSSIVYAFDEQPIQEVVTVMVEQKVSSVLVHDANKLIVGIVTERDIVRKFTLVDLEDKMERAISTLMSRSVRYVTLENLREQIIEYHLKYRVKHFPILRGEEPTVDNIVGLISITDFLRNFLLADTKAKRKNSEDDEISLVNLGVLATVAQYEQYRQIFSDLGYKVFQVKDFNDFINAQERGSYGPIIFDLDGFSANELKRVVPVIRKYPGRTCYATSNHQLIAPFRRGLKRDVQAVALKPIDVSYFNWFLSEPV